MQTSAVQNSAEPANAEGIPCPTAQRCQTNRSRLCMCLARYVVSRLYAEPLMY